MLVTQTFKDAIQRTFFDKVIDMFSVTSTTEIDGAVRNNVLVAGNQFNGNPRLTNFKAIQKDFGLEYQIDIAVTTTVDAGVTVNSGIRYAGIEYRVTEVFAFDSHTLIIGTKWQPSRS